MTTSFQFLTILNMRSTFEYHRLPSSLKRLPEKIFYQFDCTRLYMQWMLAIERIIQNWWFVFCCLQNSKLSLFYLLSNKICLWNVHVNWYMYTSVWFTECTCWSQIPPFIWMYVKYISVWFSFMQMLIYYYECYNRNMRERFREREREIFLCFSGQVFLTHTRVNYWRSTYYRNYDKHS